MTTAADILTRAADLIEAHTAIFPTSAIYLAIMQADNIQFGQPGRPLRLNLYQQAVNALAARLGYTRGRRPNLFLARWTSTHGRDQLIAEMRPSAADTVRHVAIMDAVRQIGAELGVPEAEAADLMTISGIPTFSVALPGQHRRVRVSRADVAAYAAHLAQQTKRVPVGGGPDIGYEAERDYRAEQDDQ